MTVPTTADSLRASAKRLRAAGRDHDAMFTESMIAGAEQMPALYTRWARAQAERAARFTPEEMTEAVFAAAGGN